MQFKSVKELIKGLPELKDKKLTVASKKLLKLCYDKAGVKGSKPPLIVSFHPKISLLNNNLHETHLSVEVAKKLGMTPIWIPYVYDTGYKQDKISRPTYLRMEGKYLALRASSAIMGNIMAVEKPIKDKEVKNFMKELEKHLLETLNNFKNMINPINFGHELFDFKLEMNKYTKKYIRKKVQGLEAKWLKAVKGCKSMAESMAKISISNFKDAGINIDLLMIDEVLPTLVEEVFTKVLEAKNVKNDQTLLNDLFIHFNKDNKERSQIFYTGNSQFIGFNEDDYKVFQGDLKALINGLKDHSILPTGNLVMLLFTAIGCKLVLGGGHTLEYYPDYFKKANQVLKNTPFNNKMQLLSYGNLRYMNHHNLYDITSVIRVLDKVGSRAYSQNKEFKLPDDVANNLCFLAGINAVPKEFQEFVDKEIKERETTALSKLKNKFKAVEELLEKKVSDLLKDTESVKELKRLAGSSFETANPIIIKQVKESTKEVNGLNPILVKAGLDDFKNELAKRVHIMEETIEYLQHVLGGETEEGILHDGLLLRSKRYPTIVELNFYDIKPKEEFKKQEMIKDKSEWVWAKIKTKKSELKTKTFDEYKKVFKKLSQQDT